MHWFWFWCAFAIANTSAWAFYFSIQRSRPWAMIAWLLCSGVIVLSPYAIPPSARALRFWLASWPSRCFGKFYDAYSQPAFAAKIGVGGWVAYLPNWFWFELRRVPRAQPPALDWRQVAVSGPLMIAAVALCAGLLTLDWTGVPFLVEHTAKIVAFAMAMMLIGRTFAALYRRLVGPASDPINNPFAARTPAEFWRRWNRPFRDFFDEYVFRPLGGVASPVFATLAVFCASGLMHEYVFGVATSHFQGWQILFFLIQGCAVVATLRFRPSGPSAVLSWAATIAFMVATSILFFPQRG